MYYFDQCMHAKTCRKSRKYSIFLVWCVFVYLLNFVCYCFVNCVFFVCVQMIADIVRSCIEQLYPHSPTIPVKGWVLIEAPGFR